MIVLNKKDFKKILEYSLLELPNEACGLVAGTIKENKKIIQKVYLLTNIDESLEHFSMDPKEQFDAIRDMRKNNFVLIGNFHSHPQTPSRPSEEDKRLAYDKSMSYMILSLMDREKPVLKSFRISGGKVIEEEIKEGE
ncbi:M67 family metallopeptidase [Herbivorax sp. ANBcel31]|uniref:M67 family metallopeptidase n=1 Tax=Herbivorax sp. ANBcel31 TaxID=3069754 RepID=UPI0027B2D1D0|nr:M67 family metallopeptidase [Herbivorax sp. ANBcel31]MDQ2085446.1 M67 family metallopeptidase [Herbivorax sp. ANBcel31]